MEEFKQHDYSNCKIGIHKGYRYVNYYGHPNYNTSMIYEHVLVAENMLGRYLKREECVHHINENKMDNNPDNLIIFATNADHSKYHMCIRNNLEYELVENNGVYTCINKSDKTICPDCGGKKDAKALFCKDCSLKYRVYSKHKNKERVQKAYKQKYNKYVKTNHNTEVLKKPTKEELETLLNNNNYSQIARMFNVTPNAIKKWAKKYGLYKPCFPQPPEREELEYMVNKYSKRYVALYYNVGTNTINTWVKNLNIVILPEYFSCIEDGKIFYESRDVVKEYCTKENMSVINECEYFRKAIANNETYCDKHFVIHNQKINIDNKAC